MGEKDIISLISKVRDCSNKFIIDKMNSCEVKGFAPSHGDIIFVLLQYKNLSMKELANKIGKDKSTVTALVNKLIKLGYVKKSKNNEDNRITFVSLTKEGLGLKAMFDDISEQLISTVYKGISKNEKEVLISILTKIKNNF